MSLKHVSVVAGLFAAALTGSIGAGLVDGADHAIETVFVPTDPCRLVDTRPQPDLNTGPRSEPIGPDEAALFGAHDGSDAGSPCVIPDTAAAISANVVAIRPSANGFLTLYPGDVDNPGTANLNFVAAQAPTPNAVVIPLAPDGTFNAFNAFGMTHVVIDVNGYYQPSSKIGEVGPQGPAGDDGAAGPAGPPGPANRLTDDELARLAWYEDPASPREFDAGSGASYPAFDGDELFVPTEFDDVVWVVNPQTGVRNASIPVGDGPYAAAFDGSHVFVSNYNSNTVSVIDPTSHNVVDSIDVGNNPQGVATGNGMIFVTNYTDGSLTVIDGASLSVVRTLAVGGGPSGVAFDGSLVWVANASDDEVVAVNPTSGAFVHDAPTGNQPTGVAFDGRYVYVTNLSSAGSVTVVDAFDGSSVTTIPVGEFPIDVAFDGRWTYVANNNDSTVSVIDPTIMEVVRVVETDGKPRGLVYDGTSVFVTARSIQRLLPS